MDTSAALGVVEAELFERLGCETVFDDEYIATGGQLYEVLAGRGLSGRPPGPAARP